LTEKRRCRIISRYGALAQLGARHIRIVEVVSSNLICSICTYPRIYRFYAVSEDFLRPKILLVGQLWGRYYPDAPDPLTCPLLHLLRDVQIHIPGNLTVLMSQPAADIFKRDSCFRQHGGMSVSQTMRRQSPPDYPFRVFTKVFRIHII
jgi:hypothetical protein